MSIIKNIIILIANEELEKLIQLIDALDIQNMKESTYVNTLYLITTYCYDYEKYDMAKSVIQYFREIDDTLESGYDRVVITMFRSLKFETDMLRKCLPGDVFPISIIADLMESGIYHDAIPTCERVLEVYGSLTGTQLQELYDKSMEMQAVQIQEWLWLKLVEVTPYAPKPEFIKDIDEYPEEDQKILKSLTIESKTTDNTKIEDLTLLGDKNEDLSEKDKKALYRQMMYSMPDFSSPQSILMFAKYGPINAFTREEYSENDVPRMRLSNMYDYDEDTRVKHDWFTGYCMQTGKRIKYREYAVRIPIQNGGWMGCFSSWEAAEEFAFERYPDNIIIFYLIQFFMKQVFIHKLCGPVDVEES
jgi:hypothetical protein